MLRNGVTHILDYTSWHSSRHWTVCGQFFVKQDRINTVAIDNTVSGICESCKAACDAGYANHLENNLRKVRNSKYPDYYDILKLNKIGAVGPKPVYNNVLRYRSWSKLGRYQRLVSRFKKHEKKHE